MRDLVMVSFVMKRGHNIQSDDMVLCCWKESFQLSFTHYLEAGVKHHKVRWQLATSNVTVLSESHTTIALPASPHIFQEFRNNWIFMRPWWQWSLVEGKQGHVRYQVHSLCENVFWNTLCTLTSFSCSIFFNFYGIIFIIFFRQVWIFQS